METKARLTQITNASEGTSAKGAWRKATAIFETQEQYPKTIAVDFFNSKLDEVTKIPLGTVCTVRFDISSREFNGKWYTNLSGFGIEAQTQQPPQQQPQNYAPSWAQEPQQDEAGQDDLPF